jgi:hypothetical protein
VQILGERDLAGADLAGADLSGANLEGANLSNTDLENANLSNANLRGTDLAGAKLDGANQRVQKNKILTSSSSIAHCCCIQLVCVSHPLDLSLEHAIGIKVQ